MKPFLILILTFLEFSVASEIPTFVANFLEIPMETETWDETAARDYFDGLVEKHGSDVKKEMQSVTQEDRAAYTEFFEKDSNSSAKLWHVGDATLTRLDKSVFGSAFSKLKLNLPTWASLDKVNLQDYGLYFFSVSDTDIFDGFEEMI